MSIIATRLVTIAAAAAFILPAGAGLANAEQQHNDRGYHYYCDRSSAGFDWDYCWNHYRSDWQRDHGSDRGDSHGGGGNGGGGRNW
ncbi:hypothetical protein [Nocardia jejuensis]|uniref:hypothetical protein n=1 Tax=Nocardia jejuensis TaxID=328049 RepID=UPI0008331CF5|nr:hypothetical protein [Nocardia jejuensis]